MSGATYDTDNIFAKILRGDIPCHKVYEDADTLAFMDVMPQSKGHLLVVPKAASRNLLDADATALAKTIPVVQKLANAAKDAFDADGITVMQFNEQAAGQTVYHLHFHVVPRYEGAGLKPHTGEMEDHGILAEQAKLVIAALGG
ncbi:MAG: HIT family protein [Neorhizobium sp.]|jgi:histidine triad (HIT) family protein|nr:HIT family protein [Neorhizobium sp.]